MDVAFGLFQKLQERGLDLIEELIEDGCREDLHLEFKRKAFPSTPSLSDDDRRNFSKALSGFANSDSGIVIWGVGAPGVGIDERTKHPIRHVRAFAEFLDSFISRLVSPPVSGARNLVIFEDETKDVGYVVTYVPKSERAPHRAEAEGLKHYYMRYGESFKIAEHYEMEYMFGRRLSPDLTVFWDAEPVTIPKNIDGNREIDCVVKIGVTNRGKAVANYVCLKLRFNQKGAYKHETKYRSDLIHYSKPSKASRPNFSTVAARALPGLVIYPDDYTHFFAFSFSPTITEIKGGSLPQLELFYDLFAENFRAVSGEKFIIAGKKIAEKVKKKLTNK